MFKRAQFLQTVLFEIIFWIDKVSRIHFQVINKSTLLKRYAFLEHMSHRVESFLKACIFFDQLIRRVRSVS